LSKSGVLKPFDCPAQCWKLVTETVFMCARNYCFKPDTHTKIVLVCLFQDTPVYETAGWIGLTHATTYFCLREVVEQSRPVLSVAWFSGEQSSDVAALIYDLPNQQHLYFMYWSCDWISSICYCYRTWVNFSLADKIP